ncbi:hypothetical protein INR49_004232, partial [Caranx melampygus]
MNFRTQSTCTTKKMQTKLILAGLLSFYSFTLSETACQPALLPNIDFPGADVGFKLSPDAAHCQKLCTQDAQCDFFTYIHDDFPDASLHYKCHFKASSSGAPSSTATKAGLTSGYSLKPCNPEKLVCLSKVYENLEFLGTDYRVLVTATHQHCQQVCTQDRFCRFFSFMNGNFPTASERYRCYLRYSWSIPRPPNVGSLTGVVSGFSDKIKVLENFTNACDVTFFENTEINGNIFESVPAASAEICQALCSAHSCCTLFSFESANFKCHMMDNRDELITQTKSGFKSGLPVYECLMNDSMYHKSTLKLLDSWVKEKHDDVDFFGVDMSAITKDNVTECQTGCNDDRNCQFYTYLKDNFSDANRSLGSRGSMRSRLRLESSVRPRRGSLSVFGFAVAFKVLLPEAPGSRLCAPRSSSEVKAPRRWSRLDRGLEGADLQMLASVLLGLYEAPAMEPEEDEEDVRLLWREPHLNSTTSISSFVAHHEDDDEHEQGGHDDSPDHQDHGA